MGAFITPTGQGNAADTTDDVLFTSQLDQGCLDVTGAKITLDALGRFAANANNKRVRLWLSANPQAVGSPVSGATMLVDTGVVSNSGGGWRLKCSVFKYGPFGSNTQVAVFAEIVVGAANRGTLQPTLLSFTEGAPLYAVLTGASPTAASAGDVMAHLFDIDYER